MTRRLRGDQRIEPQRRDEHQDQEGGEHDQVAIVGSINMDYRSLIWNYECGTWVSGSPTVLDIKADLLDCIEVSREVCYADWEKTALVKKVGQAVLRIMAPLM